MIVNNNYNNSNDPKDKLDVVIIGGGLSGLLALKNIIEANRNLKVHLFEANDRVGGRVFTYEKQGIKLEKGASWIGPTQTRMYELLKEFNIGTIPQYETGKNQIAFQGTNNFSEYLAIAFVIISILSVFLGLSAIMTASILIGLLTLLMVYLLHFADRKLYNLRKFYKGTIPPISIRALVQLGIVQWQLDYYASKINLEDPFSSPNAAKFDAVNLKEWVAKRLGKDSDVFKVFECATDTIFGLDMKEMSCLHALFYIKSAGNLDMLINGKGGAQQDRIQGGSSALPRAIHQKLHQFITLSKPVMEINNKKDNGEVDITFEDKTVIQAKRVIVAVPPHVLAKSIRFIGMPQKKIDFFNSVKSGQLLKLFAVFKHPFWRENGLTGQVLSTESQPCLIFDVSSETHGILLGFLVAPHAPFYLSLDDAAKKDFFLNHLGKFFGKEEILENLIMFADDNYQDDKYAVGCPVASMPIDGWKDFGSCWKQPTDNVIFWASTETSTIWNGYMEGAVRAGERAANEVLMSLQ